MTVGDEWWTPFRRERTTYVRLGNSEALPVMVDSAMSLILTS